MPVVKDPAAPGFPHGESRGYKYGCKSGHPCPVSPSCADEHSRAMRVRRERVKQNPPPEGQSRLTTKVAGRLAKTLEVVSVEDLSARTNVPVRLIKKIAANEGEGALHTAEHIAAPLDAAWAWYCYGVDVTDPAFKHGPGGFKRWCRCETCREVAGKLRKRSKAGIKSARSHITHPRAAAHLRKLVEAAESRHAMEQVTGLKHTTVVNLLADPEHPIMAHTLERLFSWTPERVAAKVQENLRARRVDGAYTAWMIGTLRAQGYPMRYICAQAGIPVDRRAFLPGRPVHNSTETAIEALHKRIGDTPATAEATGVIPYVIERTKAAARRAGYYPSATYDDNRHLDLRAIPGHQWSKADNRCAKNLHLAHEAAKDGKPASQLVREGFARDKRTVERMRSSLGLRFTYDGDGVHLHPDSVARAAWIRSMIEDYDTGERGPVEVALTIGTQYPSQMPTTHPEYVAWQATQPAVHALAWMLHTRARVDALVARTTTEHKEAA